MKIKNLLLMSTLLMLIFVNTVSAGLVADHNAVREFDLYSNTPEFQTAIILAKNQFHVGYGHTSHGSQITTSRTAFNDFMNGLGYPTDLFTWNDDGTNNALHLDDGGNGLLPADVGYSGWDTHTRNYLNNVDANVLMWSWCGQVNSVDIQSHYLHPMLALEEQYPNVDFIYMTGHLEGATTGDSWFNNNNAIRNWVAASPNRILFDFADIEKYDPYQRVNYADLAANDNCYYDSNGDGFRDSNWATVWQSSHIQDVDWYSVSCAHSQSLNCNQKVKAFWWMMAKMAGWNSNPAPTRAALTWDVANYESSMSVDLYCEGSLLGSRNLASAIGTIPTAVDCDGQLRADLKLADSVIETEYASRVSGEYEFSFDGFSAVPEFTTIGAALALIGSIAVRKFKSKKQRN